jgi:AcrR family transcriptional regulator
MSRPLGRTNPGYVERRQALARAVLPALMGPAGTAVSLRSLADIAQVSVPTLRHYFGDRTGGVAAALQEVRRMGAGAIHQGATVERGPPGPSLRWFLDELVLGFLHSPMGRLLGAGLAHGLSEPALGPVVVTEILEPTLGAVEARVAAHQARGELPPTLCARSLALALVSPVLLALLHQGPLGGAACRPLDLPAFVDAHWSRFLGGWPEVAATAHLPTPPATPLGRHAAGGLTRPTPEG